MPNDQTVKNNPPAETAPNGSHEFRARGKSGFFFDCGIFAIEASTTSVALICILGIVYAVACAMSR